MILAGDIGGTKTRLGLFRGSKNSEGGTECVSKETFVNRDFPSFSSILSGFLSPKEKIDVVSIGVAGPVEGGEVRATNLPWVIRKKELLSITKAKECLIINDIVALGYGILKLEEEKGVGDIEVINKGSPSNGGIKAIVAAGTGLGEAFIIPSAGDKVTPCPSPSEGGHADFSPRSEIEIELVRYLKKKKKFGHVSKERVISGPGVTSIYEFLRDEKSEEADPEVEAAISDNDPNPVIIKRGIEKKSPITEKTLDIFVSAYGAEAGNLALILMARGGVYMGGGIAPNIISAVKERGGLEAFLEKGRLKNVMEKIPLYVVKNQYTPLIGAASYVDIYYESLVR
jgi:glucokinase